MAEKVLKTREQADVKDTWKMEDMYASEELWEQDVKELQELSEKIGAYRGHLGESAQTLLEAQKMYDTINELAEKVYVYANQKWHENTDNGKYQNLASRAQGLLVEVEEKTSFIEPELMALPEGKVLEFCRENKELAVYQQYFENMLRQKEHILSEELESVLAAVGELAESPKDIFTMFNNADIRFPKIEDEDGNQVEVTHGRFSGFLQSQSRRVRKDAFQALYQVYKAHRNTLAATYRANVKQAVFRAKVRNYASDLEMALDGSCIPVSVYENLIEAVHEYLPALHRYVSLRKRLLGVEELHMYDLYVPMVADAEKKIPFEQAKKMVLEGLAPMGEEYLSLLKEGFSKRWIDVYENQGKRSGAYSWGAYGVHPYVLLNYQENLNNVFTLAHEMGHALHSWYSDKEQPYVYAGYKIFVAEVASTCNEALLIHHLMEQTEDKKEKAYLINYFLEQFRTTLYRQTMFAEFEKITHGLQEKGETLTADRLCEIYVELNRTYFGEDICIDKEIAMEWARIPHFYTPFYVYQYATGFSAAIALSARILEKGAAAVEDYKKFLKGGSSQYPLELLKIAGVDMEQKQPIQEALHVFEEYLEELERIL